MSPEELARLQEDTRHEQFFFDAPTVRRLVGRAASFDHPLLVCMPSLAVHLHAAGRSVTLLDRDRRFRSLPGFERWDLLQPHMVFGEHDAIFVDPPFANITPAQLARAVELLVGGMSRQPALFVCHLREQEPELQRHLSAFGLRRLGPPLGYRSVKAATQARIHLFRSA